MFEDGTAPTSLSAHEIYQQLTTGPGTGTLDNAHQVAGTEAQAEEARSKRIKQLAAKIETGWQGTAGGAATLTVGPLADSAREGTEKLRATEGLLAQQSGSFRSASTSVRPVEPKPPGVLIMGEPAPWSHDTEESITRYQSDAEHNINVYAGYDSQSLDNEHALPKEYTPLTDPGGEITVLDPVDQTTTGQGTDTRHVGTSSSHSGVTVPGQSGTTGGGGGVGTGTGPVTGASPIQTTDPSGSPINGTTPPSTVPQPRPGGGPVDQGWGGRFSGNDLGVPGGPGYGPRGTGEGGANTGGGARPGTGAVPRGGAGSSGPGALAAEESLARRGSGALSGRGGAGMGGMGGMGAGARGRGGEDDEHVRPSFLEEPDPEDVFGIDQITAPPVIE